MLDGTGTGLGTITTGAKFVESEYIVQARINNAIRGVPNAVVPNRLGIIAKVARIGAVSGIVSSAGIAGVAVINGTHNTSTWVNLTVNAGTLGVGIAATIFAAPAIGTAAAVVGIGYGVGYLFYGKQMDQYIDQNWGYK